MSAVSLPSVEDAPIKPQRKQHALKALEPESARTQEQITGYVRRRVDVKMPRRHAEILHRKLRRLQEEEAKLSDGTIVSDTTKAVLWILENEVQL